MGRYDLRLRPIYGADELTGGEQLQRGIAGAIALKQQEHVADNARRAQGQVLTGETSIMDRVRGVGRRVAGIGSAIGDAFGGGPEPTPDFVPPPPSDVNAGIARGVTQSPAPIAGSTMPVQPPLDPAAHGLAGARPAGAPMDHGIAAAIQPYSEQDDHGNTWSVDPLHAAKVAEAGQQLGHDRRIEEIEARDHSLSVDDRLRLLEHGYDRKDALQNDAQAGREELARLQAKLRAGTATSADKARLRAIQEGRLALETRRADQTDRRLDAADEDRYTKTEQGAARIDYGRGKAPDPMSASMETPEAKAARERAARSGDTHAKNVGDVQARRKGANAPSGAQTYQSAKAEEARLIKVGMTKEQARASMRAKGWIIK